MNTKQFRKDYRAYLDAGAIGEPPHFMHYDLSMQEAFRIIAEIKRNRRANVARRERDQIRRDCGLVRVRGALGGIYWE